MTARNYWYALEPDAFERDTAGLSCCETGVYIRLLNHYYRTQRPLLANANFLLRVCQAFAKEETESVTSVIDKFFFLDDPEDGSYPAVYRNRRADSEIIKSIEISGKRRSSGVMGAEKTHGKRCGKCGGKCRGKCHGKTLANANTSTITIKPPTPFPAPPGVSDELWVDWCKHRGRNLTEVAYKRQVTFLAKQPDPGACVDQSIRNGWAGLFEVGRKPQAAVERYNDDGSLKVVF